jgi:aryl-alcohol dehydrogenase-like predicted oxidoreductase
VTVGTKVRLASGDFARIADAVAKSLESSLTRLRLDHVDIFHLHNAITETGGGEALSVRQVLGDVVPAFERLRQQGKTRFLGLTAIGDAAALHQVIDARVFDGAQVVYNMLNPSAAAGLPAKLSGTGLWTTVRSYQGRWCRRRRHPCTRWRRAVRLGRASSDCESAARADRLGYELAANPSFTSGISRWARTTSPA